MSIYDYSETDEIADGVEAALLSGVRTFGDALDLARELMPDESPGGQLVDNLADSLLRRAREG